MSGESSRPARRPVRGKSNEAEATALDAAVVESAIPETGHEATFEPIPAATTPEPEPEVTSFQPLSHPIEEQEVAPEVVEATEVSAEVEPSVVEEVVEEEIEPLQPLEPLAAPRAEAPEPTPETDEKSKSPMKGRFGKSGGKGGDKPKQKRRYSPKNKSLIITGSVVGGIALVLGYSLYQVSQAPSADDIVAVYQEQSGDLGFPIDRGQEAATRFLALYLTAPEDINVRAAQTKLLEEMLVGTTSKPMYPNNVSQRIISGPTPAGLMVQESQIEANQRYTAVVETTTREPQQGRDFNGESIPDKVTKELHQVTYRINLRQDPSGTRVLVVGNPTLLPNAEIPPTAKTLPSPEAIDAPLSSEINTSLMEPFFKAWGASDRPSINALLASGAEGDWTDGLKGAQNAVRVTTKAPQALKGANAGAVTVEVEWEAPNGERQVSTYTADIAFQNSRWLISNLT